MKNLIIGKNGCGKSCLFCRESIKCLEANDDVYFYKDFRQTDPRIKYFEELEDIPLLNHCTVFIDEAQEFFSAYEWETLSKSFRLMLTKVRHSQMDLWVATEDPDLLAKVFRRSVDHYYEMKRIAGTKIKRKGREDIYPKNPWQISKINEYDIRRSENVTRPESIFTLFSGWKFFNKKDFNGYDTLTNVISPEQTNKDILTEKITRYRCTHCRQIIRGHIGE